MDLHLIKHASPVPHISAGHCTMEKKQKHVTQETPNYWKKRWQYKGKSCISVFLQKKDCNVQCQWFETIVSILNILTIYNTSPLWILGGLKYLWVLATGNRIKKERKTDLYQCAINYQNKHHPVTGINHSKC